MVCMTAEIFLLTLDKKGKPVVVPYPKKKVWDEMIHKKTKTNKKVKHSIW